MAYHDDSCYSPSALDPTGGTFDAQKACANQQTGQISTLQMQQEKLGYLKATESGLAGTAYAGLGQAGQAVGGLSPYIGDPLPQPTTKSCPCCGYCPHCGRSNQTPTYYPVYPSITCSVPANTQYINLNNTY